MRRALAIDEQSYGPDHPDVARVLNNLAALLRATKRLAEAQPLMRRAQPTRSEALTLMAEAYRHHRATPQVIIVPVPCGGSPEPVRNVKPGKYPHDKREPWRPQRAIPNKAERLRRFPALSA